VPFGHAERTNAMLESLDSIIATLAIVLGLSLVVQALQQIAKQWLDLKSKYMKLQLLSMFDRSLFEGEGAGIVLSGLRSIKTLVKSADKDANAIVGGIERVLRNYGYRDLELLQQMNEKQLRDLLSTIDWQKVPGAKDIAGQLDRINKDIDRWFGFAKDGFQQLYERRMKTWSFMLSLVLVVALNASIFDVYRQFSANAPLRDATLKWTEQMIAKGRDTTAMAPLLNDAAITQSIRSQVDSVRAILNSETFEILGWKEGHFKTIGTQQWLGNWVAHIGGWLLMTLLVSLGAPFWYDLLGALLGLKTKVFGGKNNSPSTCEVLPEAEANSGDVPALG
jgi:hypothetical protein